MPIAASHHCPVGWCKSDEQLYPSELCWIVSTDTHQSRGILTGARVLGRSNFNYTRHVAE